MSKDRKSLNNLQFLFEFNEPLHKEMEYHFDNPIFFKANSTNKYIQAKKYKRAEDKLRDIKKSNVCFRTKVQGPEANFGSVICGFVWRYEDYLDHFHNIGFFDDIP